MHPDVARLAAQFAAQGVRPYHELGVLRARDVLEGVTRVQAERVEVRAVRDVLVPGAAGSLPARVYHPDPGRRPPVVLYVHGGGWLLGSVRAADRPVRRLVRASGCVVVSLEYRRAPEDPFPAAHDDVVAAARWLAAHAGELGGDGERLVLLGDSAGGNLAAAAARSLRDAGGPPVAAQVLVYPVLAPARDTPFASYAANADGPFMTRAELEWFWSLYLRSPADQDDPRANPLAATDLAGLPPATVVVAELDPLRDEGLAYAERLREAGVEATATTYPGAAHGFWWMDGALTQAGELTEQLAGVLRALD